MLQFFDAENAVMLVARLLGFAIAIPFHELAHAFVSDKLGDPTARNLGRLTMNPLKHLDPMGLLCMLLIGVGWAKPVPVNPQYYENRKVGMAITAAAGPLSNLLLGYVVVVLYKIVYYIGVANYVVGNPAAAGVTDATALFPGWLAAIVSILFYLALINVNLAIFNLIPIPPFDGSRILGLILPDKLYFAIQKYERYIMFGVLALIFIVPRLFGVSPIGWLLGTVGGYVFDAFSWASGYIDALFRLITGL